MWKLDYKESWMPKNQCFWTVVLEKTLESPLDYEEIQQVHPEGDQSWMFIGRTDAEAETPILWPPDAKSWLIWKDPDAGKNWNQEEKGTTEDEMVGWHHNSVDMNLGKLQDSEGQGSLVCYRPWSWKELDMTERLNWLRFKERAIKTWHTHIWLTEGTERTSSEKVIFGWLNLPSVPNIKRAVWNQKNKRERKTK